MVGAIADAMKTEYKSIVDAGFLLQIDAPDLASDRSARFPDLSVEQFRSITAMHVEAINHALEGISLAQVRLHVCWGNYVGPHHWDIPLEDVVDVILQAQVGALYIEGANPRHAHEWKVWQHTKLPDGMVLIPGVIDNKTSHIEHPELIADRIVNYARVVGRENVIAGVDCGFATAAARSRNPLVHPAFMWAKFRALAEGAELATRQLWHS